MLLKEDTSLVSYTLEREIMSPIIKTERFPGTKLPKVLKYIGKKNDQQQDLPESDGYLP